MQMRNSENIELHHTQEVNVPLLPVNSWSEMLRDVLAAKIRQSSAALVASGVLPSDEFPCEVSEPRDASFGDFTTNFALVAANAAGLQPRKIAEALAAQLSSESDFESVEVAGPGFLNFTIAPCLLSRGASELHSLGESVGRFRNAFPERILVEFVSVNPNGPIHVGHGRGAAYGDTLCRILEAAGHTVGREFYVNDGVNSEQMRQFALSVQAKYLELVGRPFQFPDDGYRGEYIDEIARRLLADFGSDAGDKGVEFFQAECQRRMLELQRRDLERFGVRFEKWFSEQSLHENGEVQKGIEEVRAANHCFEFEGALWLRSTEFGDDKDRVVVREDGRPTYIASDIAYHKNKFDRGWERLIDIWGADHHGYIARIKAVVQALGHSSEDLEIIIIQIVRFFMNGQPVAMSKRSGEMVRLSELMDDVGVDVARFFYLMRSHETHMDFDLTLAKEHSERNPVYYVQYAHARICSLLAKAREQNLGPDADALGELSWERAEKQLLLKLCDLPFEIALAAKTREVHRIATYTQEVARQYHDFYEKCRVIAPESPRITAGRLALCECARNVLRASFHLLGISAPERM